MITGVFRVSDVFGEPSATDSTRHAYFEDNVPSVFGAAFEANMEVEELLRANIGNAVRIYVDPAARPVAGTPRRMVIAVGELTADEIVPLDNYERTFCPYSIGPQNELWWNSHGEELTELSFVDIDERTADLIERKMEDYKENVYLQSLTDGPDPFKRDK